MDKGALSEGPSRLSCKQKRGKAWEGKQICGDRMSRSASELWFLWCSCPRCCQVWAQTPALDGHWASFLFFFKVSCPSLQLFFLLPSSHSCIPSFYPQWGWPDSFPSCSMLFMHLFYFSLGGPKVDMALSPGEAPQGPGAELCKSHRETHHAQWNEKKKKNRNYLYLPFPLSALKPHILYILVFPFLLAIPALAPSLSNSQQPGRISPMQASGTLHFQSLNEARAQRSLLYHKLEHEKLIHFIHLSEGERERGGKAFAARFLTANLSGWREAAGMEVFTDRQGEPWCRIAKLLLDAPGL